MMIRTIYFILLISIFFFSCKQAEKKEDQKTIDNITTHLSFWKNGCNYFNITGPDGERLEFNQIL